MTRPILEVTARWRLGQPGGFAVTVAFETSALGEHFAKQLMVALNGLDQDARWSPEVALGHLRDVGRLPESMRHETIRRRAVGIIAWLQERGHLAPDEHNGIVWRRAGEISVRKPRQTARAASREGVKSAKKKSKRPRKKT